MLAFRAIPYVWVTLGFYALSALAQRFTHFPMPSFLPLKLSLFTIGILIATAYIGDVNEKTKRTLIGLVVAIAIFSGHDTNDRLLLLGVTTLLMSILFWKKSGVIGQITQSCASFLSNRLAKSLGDLSYSIYLVHLLIMLPISSWLIQFPTFLNLPGLVRGTLIAGLTLIPTYIIATLLLKLIEKPGVSFGKQLVKKLQKVQPA
jgi:peptidoglycan/LPS O-acetylase OafA/YrhL